MYQNTPLPPLNNSSCPELGSIWKRGKRNKSSTMVLIVLLTFDLLQKKAEFATKMKK